MFHFVERYLKLFTSIFYLNMYFVYCFYTFYLLTYVVVNAVNKSENIFDYCKHPDCSLRNQHTMCVARNKQSPRLFASGMTTWMKYQMLLLHNRHRDNIATGFEAGQPPAANMRKMYWDYELEEMAEVWARQCQKRHDECRNTIRFNVIQNMDVRPVVPRVTEAQILADAVGAWFSGSRILPPEYVWSFRPSNCSGSGGCNSHWYSAAAWASTWRIGCSQALCTARQRSCVLFRKRRTPQAVSSQPLENVTRSTVSENILLRTNYMTTAKQKPFDNYDITPLGYRGSPIYRGLVEEKEKKRKEPRIIAYTFCNYGPAGNIDGFPIYEPGHTCSNCPSGTKCGVGTHRGLCSLLGDPEN